MAKKCSVGAKKLMFFYEFGVLTANGTTIYWEGGITLFSRTFCIWSTLFRRSFLHFECFLRLIL